MINVLILGLKDFHIIQRFPPLKIRFKTYFRFEIINKFGFEIEFMFQLIIGSDYEYIYVRTLGLGISLV